MKGEIYLKEKLLKDSFEVKRYGKVLLVQIKEEETYKILIDGAFTEDKDSLLKKMEPHKEFNNQWHTIYNRDLLEFTKNQILEMRPKEMDIHMLTRDNENRTGLEFEKDIMDPHIIIGGENIRLRMKKEKPTLFERCLQFGHQKSTAEVTRNLAQTAQNICRREECTIAEGTFASNAKNHIRQETRKYVENIK